MKSNDWGSPGDYLKSQFPEKDKIKIERNASPKKQSLNDTQKKIAELTDALKDLLIYKNQKYGNSALEPQNVFYKGDATNSILIRLDDKIGRIRNNGGDLRLNDISDVVGYCVLLMISMGASAKDIAKFKD